MVDTLTAVHDSFYEFFVNYAEDLDLARTGPMLDDLADAITTVKVVGSYEEEEAGKTQLETKRDSRIAADLASSGIRITASGTASQVVQEQGEFRTRSAGVRQHYIHFGAVRAVLERILDALGTKRVWLLLDEWSSIPLVLQPFLADLIRRSVFPLRGITVKIAAIEQRSEFRLSRPDRDYIGIEIGADAAADVNLDDFMVFENDAERARQFFKELLFNHVAASDEFAEFVTPPRSPDDMIRQAYSQLSTFDEIVRAAEGVPRDAINITSLAAQQALDITISVNHVRKAARNWYQRDKETAVRANANAQALLHSVIDEVIGARRARAFLLRSNTRHPLIDTLFDARLLHILKRNVSTPDHPGVRYDVYKLDYGCYVDLIATAKATQGLIPSDPDGDASAFIDVPPDDYRSIRRAILDLDAFGEHENKPLPSPV